MDVPVGDDKTLQGVVLQDAGMKEYMHSFPAVLFIDATYKFLEIRLPIYLTLCEDSMGNSEVVSVSILSCENEESFSWMFQAIRARNAEMDRMRVIVTDMDLKERQMLRQCFPNSCLLLCLFHNLRAFRKKVTCLLDGYLCRSMVAFFGTAAKVSLCTNRKAYDDLYEQLKRDAPHKVVRYYDDNWHDIRQPMVMAFTLQVGNFLIFTNN